MELYHKRKCPVNLFRKINKTLKPDDTLKAAADFRLPIEVQLIDADIKGQLVAVNGHQVNFFTGKAVRHQIALLDFTQDGILITLHTVRHTVGIHQTENIFILDFLGNRGIHIHIFQRQCFDGFLITTSCRCNQVVAHIRVFFDFQLLLFILFDGEHNISLD